MLHESQPFFVQNAKVVTVNVGALRGIWETPSEGSALTGKRHSHCRTPLTARDVYDPALVASQMQAGAAPGHACEYETSTMLHLFPHRVDVESVVRRTSTDHRA
eukprot:SAG11_NODE_146_length_14788_cov_5.672884_10_plen_104_part_00